MNPAEAWALIYDRIEGDIDDLTDEECEAVDVLAEQFKEPPLCGCGARHWSCDGTTEGSNS